MKTYCFIRGRLHSSVDSRSPASTPSKHRSTPSGSIRNTQDAQQIIQSIWNNYLDRTPQRVKLLDTFMAFLMAVGALQFVYCVIGGNYVRITHLLCFSVNVPEKSYPRSLLTIPYPLAFQCFPFRLRGELARHLTAFFDGRRDRRFNIEANGPP